jgi:WD40 repeat protein
VRGYVPLACLFAVGAMTACASPSTMPTMEGAVGPSEDLSAVTRVWQGTAETSPSSPAHTATTTNPTRSLPPDTQSLLLVLIWGGGQLAGAFLDPASGELTPGPSGYLPVAWSPSGERLILMDTERRGYYVSGPLGQDPLQVLTSGEGAADIAGWWLSDHEVLLPLHDPSVGPLGCFWYLVDTDNRRVLPINTGIGEASVIYAASPDGSYWVEDSFLEVEVVTRDGERTPLWADREIGGEQIPYPPQVAILPDASAVVFPGCNGSWAAQTLSCGIIRAEIRDADVVSHSEIYHIGSHSGIRSVEVSPDGGRLAFYSYPEELIIVMDLGSLEIIKAIDWSGVPRDASLVWSPDSSILAVSRPLDTGSMVIYQDLVTGEESTTGIPSGDAILLGWRDVPGQ